MAFLLNFYNIVGGHSQVMYRLADVLVDGGYDESFPSSEDYDLWVRLLRRGRIETLPLIGMKQRDHGARSLVRHAHAKRANWNAIMGGALGGYLGRTVTKEEIAALITLWRHDGAIGMARLADATMREAFSRFRREHRDRNLQHAVRRRTARQWMEAAGRFMIDGQRAEAARYMARAARWSPSSVLRTLRG